MSTHNEHGNSGHEPEAVDTSHGFENTDVRISGIVVFLTALAIFVAVVGVLAYGIGKAINAHMQKEDGPTNKWSKQVDVRPLGNLASSPELQNKLAQMTQQFPTPRLQTDDGNEDVAELHGREDLLLEHYSWVDGAQGAPRRVRIPIERAMAILAKNGLPVAPAASHATLMTGDKEPTVQAPLTNGFALTGYEHDQAIAQKVEGSRPE